MAGSLCILAATLVVLSVALTFGAVQLSGTGAVEKAVSAIGQVLLVPAMIAFIAAAVVWIT